MRVLNSKSNLTSTFSVFSAFSVFSYDSYAVEVMVDILIRNNFFDCEDIYMRHLVELLLEAGETQHVSSIINCFVNRGYHNVDTSIRRGGSDKSGWADKGLAKKWIGCTASFIRQNRRRYDNSRWHIGINDACL